MRPSLRRHVLVLLREELGLNQKDFADYVGCSESVLQAVERGPDRLKLSDALAEKIFVATGIDPEWLLANDFSKPMVAFWQRKPYTKEVFEAVQGRKHLPPDWTQELQDTWALRAFGEIMAALASAQETSIESALVASRRVWEFAEKMAKDFGGNLEKHAKAVTWPVFDYPAINLLESKLAEFRKRDAPLTPLSAQPSPSDPSPDNLDSAAGATKEALDHIKRRNVAALAAAKGLMVSPVGPAESPKSPRQTLASPKRVGVRTKSASRQPVRSRKAR